MSAFRIGKFWQGKGLQAVWQLQPLGPSPHKKVFLTLDANQASFGLSLQRDKPAGTRAQTALCNLVRKHIGSGRLTAIDEDTETRDLWLSFCVGKVAAPNRFVRLKKDRPPELALIGDGPETLLRLSSQGTFTKRKPFADPMPTGDRFRSLTEELLDSLAVASNADEEAAPEDQTEDEVSNAAISPEQRDAANKLKRRHKTISKSIDKLKRDLPSDAQVKTQRQHADLLQSFAHRIKPDTLTITLTAAETGLAEDVMVTLDPDKSPGQNIEEAFRLAKRMARKLKQGGEQLATLEAAATSLWQDIVRLRAEPTSSGDVATTLKRHGLKPQLTAQKQATPTATPWRTYEIDGSLVLVGKGPKENDLLTKQAKANDYWLHAAGVTGSHVIIPVRKSQPPSDSLLFAAAVLAIHFSKFRGDLAGEVQITTKQHLRKKKNLPAGKWLVERCETRFFRYSEADLAQVLKAKQ